MRSLVHCTTGYSILKNNKKHTCPYLPELPEPSQGKKNGENESNASGESSQVKKGDLSIFTRFGPTLVTGSGSSGKNKESGHQILPQMVFVPLPCTPSKGCTLSAHWLHTICTLQKCCVLKPIAGECCWALLRAMVSMEWLDWTPVVSKKNTTVKTGPQGNGFPLLDEYITS